MAEHTKITALDNGPYLVKDPVLLLDAEGNEFRTEREQSMIIDGGILFS